MDIRELEYILRLTDDFHVEEFPGEAVVYDHRGPELHVLKGLAADIFLKVDGKRTAADIADEAAKNGHTISDAAATIITLQEKKLVSPASDHFATPNRRSFLKASLIAAGALIISMPVPVAAATLSQCMCATVNTSSGNAPANACRTTAVPGTSPCPGGVSGAATTCGTVACFQPALGRCTCFEDDATNSCGAAGGTITQKCCQGNDPTNPICADTML